MRTQQVEQIRNALIMARSNFVGAINGWSVNDYFAMKELFERRLARQEDLEDRLVNLYAQAEAKF